MSIPSKHKLTDSEWELMDYIWKQNKAITVRQVLDAVYPNESKAYTTVQTFMNILVEKGVLKREKNGMINFYTPLYSRENIVQNEVSHFINKVFDGSVSLMVNHLIKSDDIDKELIDELRKKVEER